jgi:ribonuclease HI
MKYTIHTDGGARGNPGPSAIGVFIQKENGVLLHKFGKKIGNTTNNVAEYTAVIEALTWLSRNIQNDAAPVYAFYLDSTLVVNQLNGLWKMKEAHLRVLLFKIRELEQQVGGNVSYTYVPREENTDADFLVNQALDTP